MKTAYAFVFNSCFLKGIRDSAPEVKLKEGLRKAFVENKIDASVVPSVERHTVVFIAYKKDVNKILNLAEEIFNREFPDSDFSESVSLESAEDVDSSAYALNNAQKTLADIKELIGAEEFKSAAEELVKILPEVKRNNACKTALNRNYIFFIDEGHGISTCIKLLGDLIAAMELRGDAAADIVEISEAKTDDAEKAFQNTYEALDKLDKKRVGLLCIDISEWINSLRSDAFKKMLLAAEVKKGYHVLVFRAPYVKREQQNKIAKAINDIIFARQVRFYPLSDENMRDYTAKYLKQYGFEMADDAWYNYLDRISKEESDGTFYGFKTLSKVNSELLFIKQLDNAGCGATNNIISAEDTAKLLRDENADGDDGMAQLDALVGLEAVKRSIKEIVAAIEEKQSENTSLNMRFVGPPGTGKTTVARIVGRIFREKGALKIGDLYEYNGRELCSKYVGGTAPKTESILKEAKGSVLFIDEAYSLYDGSPGADYGKEALATLVSGMENYRGELVVIMAGYKDEMAQLMRGNRGLESKMPYVLEFEPYSRQQLFEIFKNMATANLPCDDDMLVEAEKYFMSLSDEALNDDRFDNARFARSLFERVRVKAAFRKRTNNLKELRLSKQDFVSAAADNTFRAWFERKNKTKIGF